MTKRYQSRARILQISLISEATTAERIRVEIGTRLTRQAVKRKLKCAVSNRRKAGSPELKRLYGAEIFSTCMRERGHGYPWSGVPDDWRAEVFS